MNDIQFQPEYDIQYKNDIQYEDGVLDISCISTLGTDN